MKAQKANIINSHITKKNCSQMITKREIECLNWIAQGKTLAEVGEVLSISARTAKAHIANIKRKLQCTSLFQLGMYYNQHLRS